MKISEAGGETALIEIIKANYGSAGVGDLALGIGDDAAIINSGDNYTLVTTDLLVDNTHFRMDINEPYLLGWKSAAVNISDIAAMGGVPTYAFVSIGLPDIDVSIVESIYKGMRDACEKFGCVIAGGDTVSSKSGIVLNITQLGWVEKEFAAKRSNAKPGDCIIVTGTIGDSLAGLKLLLENGLEKSRCESDYLVDRHLKPEPRINEARAAVKTGKVTSMMDLSDGLSSDIAKLCKASGVGAVIAENNLPVSDELHRICERKGWNSSEIAEIGGEDYELLITCDRNSFAEVISAIESVGTKGAVIGQINESNVVKLLKSDSQFYDMPKTWEHF